MTREFCRLFGVFGFWILRFALDESVGTFGLGRSIGIDGFLFVLALWSRWITFTAGGLAFVLALDFLGVFVNFMALGRRGRLGIEGESSRNRGNR
jgi:hypothetical protein